MLFNTVALAQQDKYIQVYFNPSSDTSAFIDSVNNYKVAFQIDTLVHFSTGWQSEVLNNLWFILCNGNVDSLASILNEFIEVDSVALVPFPELLCSQPVSVNDAWLVNGDEHLSNTDAYCAWTISTGNPDIKIAIVDADFKTNHPDLSNQIVSLSFLPNTHTTPSLTDNHGTEVSGLAAAETNNSIGTAAIGYNSKIRAFDCAGFWLVATGIEVASLHEDVKVINVSWSRIGVDESATALILEEVVNHRGKVVVLAAGNVHTAPSGHNHSAYASIPGVINVGGVDKNDSYEGTLWYDSHFNEWYYHARNQYIDVVAQSVDVTTTKGSSIYGTVNGTSYAAPQVAGLVALMYDVNPCLTPPAVEEIIKRTTDPIIDGHLYPGLLGTGRINAYKALLATQSHLEINAGLNEWTGEYVINDELIVPSNAHLLLTGKIYMGLNAKIVVEKGGTFTIDGGTITASNCNTELWYGIEVEGDNTLNQFGTGNQGKLIVKNGALIEHAEVAVRVWKKDQYNTTGGIVNVSNSTFKNNHKSIEFMSYHNTSQSNGAPFRNFSSVVNNTFEITSEFRALHLFTKAQVSMWDVHGIPVTDNTFINHVPHLFTHPFAYLLLSGFGVELIDASSTIRDNHFEGLQVGIRVNPLVSNPKVVIKDNVFEKNDLGTAVLEHDFVLLQNNLFDGNFNTGSHIHASNGFELTENTFKNNLRGSNFAWLGQSTNESYKNVYEENLVGSSSTGASSSSNLIYTCNDFEDPHSFYDIYVASGKITNVQGTCIAPPRNKFSHTCNYAASDLQVFQNHPGQVWYPYFLNTPDPRFNLSCFSTSKVDEFSCVGFTPNFSCPSILTTQNPSHSTISILIGNVSGKKGELDDVKDERYVLVDGGQGNSLLDFIVNIDPDETPGSIRDAVLDVAPYASIEVLQACLDKSPSFFSQRELYEILKFNSPLPNSIREQENTYNDRIGSSYADSLSALQIGNSLVDSLNAEVAFAETKVDLAISKAINQMLHDTNQTSTIEDIIDIMKESDKVEMKIPLLRAYWEAENWVEASHVLDDLSQVSEYEEIHNVLSQMHDEKSEGRNPSLLYLENEDFRNDIHNLASDTSKIGCWFARGLTSVFTDSLFVIYIDSIELPSYGKKEMLSEVELKDTESSPYSIYPNPAENWITITGGEGGMKNYRITSLEGKLIREGTLQTGSSESRISLEHISHGVYLLMINTAKGESFTHKIIVK